MRDFQLDGLRDSRVSELAINESRCGTGIVLSECLACSVVGLQPCSPCERRSRLVEISGGRG